MFKDKQASRKWLSVIFNLMWFQEFFLKKSYYHKKCSIQYIPFVPSHVLSHIVCKDLSLECGIDEGGCHIDIESPRRTEG